MTSLYERWQENKDRPAWVRNNRSEIEERVEVGDRIPEPLAAIDDWLDKYKATVTRQLNPENDDDSMAEGGDD